MKNEGTEKTLPEKLNTYLVTVAGKSVGVNGHGFSFGGDGILSVFEYIYTGGDRLDREMIAVFSSGCWSSIIKQ